MAQPHVEPALIREDVALDREEAMNALLADY